MNDHVQSEPLTGHPLVPRDVPKTTNNSPMTRTSKDIFSTYAIKMSHRYNLPTWGYRSSINNYLWESTNEVTTWKYKIHSQWRENPRDEPCPWLRFLLKKTHMGRTRPFVELSWIKNTEPNKTRPHGSMSTSGMIFHNHDPFVPTWSFYCHHGLPHSDVSHNRTSTKTFQRDHNLKL